MSKAIDKRGGNADMAERWQGWGTALKPSHEPIVVARKPLQGTVAGNVLAHGTGALNVDGCRIAHDGRGVWGDHGQTPENHAAQPGSGGTTMGTGWNRPGSERNDLGRWPANTVLVHDSRCERVGERKVPGHKGYPNGPGGRSMHYTSDARGTEVRPNAWKGHADADGTETISAWACVDGCPVKALDEQSGERRSSGVYERGPSSTVVTALYAVDRDGRDSALYDDAGGASRFFLNVQTQPVEGHEHEILTGDRSFYVAKASRSERNAGLPDGERSPHPTVKPLALMRWLVRLVTPPESATGRRSVVLDPFAGSGTCGIACVLEGFSYIGVEQDEEYVRIAEARIRFWQEHGEDGMRVVRERDAADRKREQVEAAGQDALF